MSFIKYRVREVAADFGMTPKEVSEVAGKYFDKPKSNSQVLTDEQLNVIFDHITQNRQIDSLEQVFAAAKKPEPKPAAESWQCTCGAAVTGKFCPECGKPRPAADGWTCSCGAVNKGKFCAECGAKKPAGVPQYKCDKCGWEPDDPAHPPKFCPECGDPFDDGDVQG